MYLECCLKADCAVAAWDVCPPPAQSPDSKVLKALEEAELQSFTQKLDPASTCDHTLTGESIIGVFFAVLLTIASC